MRVAGVAIAMALLAAVIAVACLIPPTGTGAHLRHGRLGLVSALQRQPGS